ncbi:MAG: chlorite dismutase, partial [Chloroflexi bacterium]|nr:chlorite dismutase [Chloroflexota bacterium]
MAEGSGEQTNSRQFVRFAFYKVDPSWRRLAGPERQAGKGQFAAIVDEFACRMMVRSYSTVGSRGDADLLL